MKLVKKDAKHVIEGRDLWWMVFDVTLKLILELGLRLGRNVDTSAVVGD